MPPRRSPRLVAAEKKRAAAALGESCCTVRRLLLTDKQSGGGVVHPGEPEDDDGANRNHKYFVGNGKCSSGAWTKCVNYDDCKSETCSLLQSWGSLRLISQEGMEAWQKQLNEVLRLNNGFANAGAIPKAVKALGWAAPGGVRDYMQKRKEDKPMFSETTRSGGI